MNVIGEVRGKRAIIVDDEIDTAGTLIEIVRALEREGVNEIYACATHGVLSDPAVDRIRDSSLREVVLTDSIPLPPAKRISKIKTFSIAPLIGEAIKRIHRGESVGALFSSEVALTQEMLIWEDGIARTLDLRDDDDPIDGEPRRRPISPAGDPGHRRWPAASPRPSRATDEPPAPPARRPGRPRDSGRRRPATGATSSARRAGARRSARGRLPRLRQPGDEPDPDRAVGRVLGRPRASLTFVLLVVGYGTRLLELSRLSSIGRATGGRTGRLTVLAYTVGPCLAS